MFFVCFIRWFLFCFCVRSSFTSIFITTKITKETSQMPKLSISTLICGCKCVCGHFRKKNDDECLTLTRSKPKTKIWMKNGKQRMKKKCCASSPSKLITHRDLNVLFFIRTVCTTCQTEEKNSFHRCWVSERSCEFWWNSNCSIISHKHTIRAKKIHNWHIKWVYDLLNG